MSSEEQAFNLLQYHNGTVWPHDTALIAAGMRRYGFSAESARLIRALLDTATAFGHRLPELFAGFERDETDLPVRHPAALVPQAWAAAAPLLVLRTMLDLKPNRRRLLADPLPGFARTRLVDKLARAERADNLGRGR
jgi:glycogen debranching enzyme